MKLGGADLEIAVVSSTQITVTVSQASTKQCKVTLAWNGIRVRALGAGEGTLTLAMTSASVIQGVTAGTTSLGKLATAPTTPVPTNTPHPAEATPTASVTATATAAGPIPRAAETTATPIAATVTAAAPTPLPEEATATAIAAMATASRRPSIATYRRSGRCRRAAAGSSCPFSDGAPHRHHRCSRAVSRRPGLLRRR